MAKLTRRPLTIPEILRWADAHREATGKWPTLFDGSILGAKFESWGAVDQALRHGFRGFPEGSSLGALLAEHRDARTRFRQPPLTEEQILRWADQHHERTGAWPARKAGAIPETGGEKWLLIDEVLRRGGRGLPGGSSLVRLLAEHRGVRHPKQLPRLTDEQILAWADAHRQRTGEWPKTTSGPIADAPGETWMAVAMALDQGHRGLPGGTTLARLLAEQRDVRNRRSPPVLSVQQILCWADAFHERTGRWPNTETGSVLEAPAETWAAIDHALKRGSRGLPGGFTLAELLAVERDVRNQISIPNLTHTQIVVWADAHYRRTGEWPTQHSGPIQEAAHESWRNVDAALKQGARGFRGGSSLPKLLAQYRRKRYRRVRRSRLSKKKILAWADVHHQRTGQWPHSHSGRVVDAPGETWLRIDKALLYGHRGLPGGFSLLKLLVKKRNARDRRRPPPLTEEQILFWASLHCQRTGRWPTEESGAIADAPGETWKAMQGALRTGRRGLPGGSSIARLRAKAACQPST